MKKDWLQDIHDKMQDYEVEEPRGLWEDIRRAREAAAEKNDADDRQSVLWLWGKRLSAVAAVLVALLAVNYWVNDRMPVSDTAPTLQAHDAIPTDTENTVSDTALIGEDENVALGTQENVGRKVDKMLPEKEKKGVTQTEVSSVVFVARPVDKGDEAQTTSTPPAEERPKEKKRQSLSTRHDYLADMPKKRTESGGLSLGIFTAGGMGTTLQEKTGTDVASAPVEQGTADWADTPELGILVFNRGQETERKLKHRLPIRTGLSLTYAFSDRLSLESGVTYARLTSDLREGSDSHYITGEQSLHYVGVPLRLNYKILSWNGFDVYASSGVLAEQCVSGKVKRAYVLDNQSRKTETEKLDSKPFQFSVNAAVGVQYRLSSSVALYAEPGVSYYLKDGTDIETIYKEKPLNFNLNIGIRLNIGNK